MHSQAFSWRGTGTGSSTRARTRDLRMNSPALYRLRYRGTRPGFHGPAQRLCCPWLSSAAPGDCSPACFFVEFFSPMTIHRILKMGDPRLLRIARPVTGFDTEALHCLVRDMLDTMHDANGAGLAAPQIGVDLQLVVFGSGEPNPRYPGRPPVPLTVLLNPVITPLGQDEQEDWEGCLSVPGLRGMVPRWSRIRYTGVDPYGHPIDRSVDGFHARVV